MKIFNYYSKELYLNKNWIFFQKMKDLLKRIAIITFNNFLTNQSFKQSINIKN